MQQRCYVIGVTDSSVGLGLGTRLRHLVDLLDNDLTKVYADLGLPGFRPRFTGIVRVLVAQGPSSIRDLAAAIKVTHSAASQTVGQMARQDLVELRTGADARQRIVHLTEQALALVPVLDAEWATTTAAAEALDAELPMPLFELVNTTIEALERRSFRQRFADVSDAGLTSTKLEVPESPS
jgi:DNA-binding MarR family transcriptional regulator